MLNKMQNHKAQISDVMTWVVATIIIIVILVVFIYASSLLAQKTKIIKLKEVKMEIAEENMDWVEMKTSFAYSESSEQNKAIIDAWKTEQERPEYSGGTEK